MHSDDLRSAPASPLVELDVLSGSVAVVSLTGEHDLSTHEAIETGVRRAADYPVVLVDLSQCSFIDSTVIAVIVSAHRTRVTRSARLELILPPEARHVDRIARMSGLSAIMPVHTSREAALEAHAEAEGGKSRARNA